MEQSLNAKVVPLELMSLSQKIAACPVLMLAINALILLLAPNVCLAMHYHQIADANAILHLVFHILTHQFHVLNAKPILL
jgi:hypothetical protein